MQLRDWWLTLTRAGFFRPIIRHSVRSRENIVRLPSGCTVASKMRLKSKFCGTLCQPLGWLGLKAKDQINEVCLDCCACAVWK